MRSLLIIFLLCSCSLGKHSPREPVTPEPSPFQQLIDVKSKYLELLPEVQDGFGFIYVDRCDSLIFSCLLLLPSTDVHAAESDSQPGKFYRRPDQKCFEKRGQPDGSDSEISRDQLLGLMFRAHYYGDLGTLDDLYRYGKAHSWIMGAGPPSRTYFNPVIRKTLALLILDLGGERYPSVGRKDLMTDWGPGLNGYQAHIQIIHILLRGRVGPINDDMLRRIDEHYKREPKNGLFSFANGLYNTGNQDDTILLLLSRFPHTRLPTNADWCPRWLWEEDSSKWDSCPGDEKHSGGELIFITTLLEEHLLTR